MPARLLIVSPVFNEAIHLERTARSVAAQTVRPDRWVIVDDGSSDETPAIARRLAAELDFVEFLAAPQSGPAARDKLALAKEARAFNLGLRHAGLQAFDYVGKLDGDIELPPHWFEALLARFEADPRLGLAGGRLVEPRPGGWERNAIPDHHVHGAVKLFRRQCLTDIGGIPERLAWDTIDEVYARMRGHRTQSFPDLVARHHRPYASADGRLRGQARHGECAWILHYGAAWVFLRAFKTAGDPPRGLSGAAYAFGYVRAAARRRPRVDDPAFRRFIRGELHERIRVAAGRPPRAEDRDTLERSIAVEANEQEMTT